MRPLAVLIAALAAGAVAPTRAADLSGPWGLEFQRAGTSAVYLADCLWEQDGPRLTGACTSGFESIVSVTGTVDAERVRFEFVTREAATFMRFEGLLDGTRTTIAGTWAPVGSGGESGGGTFTATRRPSGDARAAVARPARTIAVAHEGTPHQGGSVMNRNSRR